MSASPPRPTTAAPSARAPATDLELAHRAARHVLDYPFKTWGFGEDIALRALLELDDVTGQGAYRPFVGRLVGAWCDDAPALEPPDHVAPGVVLLELYERTGSGRFLDRALELAQLLTSFPRMRGVRVHRRDLAGLDHLVWVDCMALDGPFLARLATVTGDDGWRDEATDALLGYADALQDDADGLFVHGFDVVTGRRSPCRWARGNGWALHGLCDTLEVLPRPSAAAADATTRLRALVSGLASLQDESGLWHTVLDDPTTPLEASTAALFGSGIAKAQRLGAIEATGVPRADAVVAASLSALRRCTRVDGGLEISSATPVGDRDTYARQGLGVYPWGQGPLILALLEGRRAPGGLTA